MSLNGESLENLINLKPNKNEEETLAKMISKYREEKCLFEKLYDRNEKEILASSNEINQLKQKITTTDQSIFSLNTEKSNINRSVQNLNENLEEISLKLTEEKSKYNEQVETQTELMEKLKIDEDRLEESNERCFNLSLDKAQFQKNLQRTETYLKNLENTSLAIKNKIENFETVLESIQNSIKLETDEIFKIEESIEEQSHELNTLLKEKENMVSEILDLKSNGIEKNDLDNLKQYTENNIKSLEETKNSFNTAIDSIPNIGYEFRKVIQDFNGMILETYSETINEIDSTLKAMIENGIKHLKNENLSRINVLELSIRKLNLEKRRKEESRNRFYSKFNDEKLKSNQLKDELNKKEIEINNLQVEYDRITDQIERTDLNLMKEENLMKKILNFIEKKKNEIINMENLKNSIKDDIKIIKEEYERAKNEKRNLEARVDSIEIELNKFISDRVTVEQVLKDRQDMMKTLQLENTKLFNDIQLIDSKLKTVNF